MTPAPGDAPAERSLWAYLRLTISGALFILVVALALAVIVIPAATKSVPLTVLTSSMEPGLPPGTLLVVRPVEPADIRIGDVVTYQIRSGEPDVITHRVIAITTTAAGELSFALQGDNNGAPDPDAVRAAQVQGRLWYSLPYLGWVNNAAGGDLRATAIPIIAVACLLYAAWALLSGLRDRRKKAKADSGASTGHDGEAHNADLTPRPPLKT